MRKSLALLAVVVTVSSVASAQTYVRGYVRNNGIYVSPHFRSYNDGNQFNNWSYRGNSNPFTGTKGYRSYQPYSFNSYRY